jgi:hypothetical protein
MEGPMLARRFTIVCLLLTLFGMIFAMLAANAGRRPRPWDGGVVVSCITDDGNICASPPVD